MSVRSFRSATGPTNNPTSTFNASGRSAFTSNSFDASRDSSAYVYSQHLNKSRCIASVVADTKHHRFLAGSLSLHTALNNEIHLIEFNEDRDDAICRKLYQNHKHEIWNISCCPNDKDLFFTVYNEGKKGFKASLWKMVGLDEEDAMEGIDEDGVYRPTSKRVNLDSSEELDVIDNPHKNKNLKKQTKGGATPFHNELEQLINLEVEDVQLYTVLWDPSGTANDRVLSIDSNNVREWRLNHDMKNGKCSQVYNLGSDRRIQNGKWNPNNSNTICVASGSRLVTYDLRTQKPAQTIENAHDQKVRDVDFNPNHQYVLVSGGDDCFIRFWDVRNYSTPIKVLAGHSHWVTNVKYSPFHDELVLSSSSDSLVNLWRIPSVASNPITETNLSEEESTSPTTSESSSSTKNGNKKKKQRPKDCLLRTSDDHEESVYSIAWSRKSPWIYASVSYDGKVLIHTVPQSERDRILAIDE